jgi:hypothetical protein
MQNILNQPKEDIIRACSITYQYLYDQAVSDDDIEKALNEVILQRPSESRMEMILYYTMDRIRTVHFSNTSTK